MKSVALHNLGCKVNAYEIEYMQQMLQENGYNIVPFDTIADIYIINTCSVTNIADRKSRQMLHRAKKKNPDAVVVATGCYVQTGQEILEEDACIDLMIGNNKKKDIITILETYLKEQKVTDAVIDIALSREYEEMCLKQTAEHTRAYIKIQDGCNQFCSYCIIPLARGRVRSRPMEHILEEVKGLTAAGCLEIVLTGIHISSYGIDFKGNSGGDYASAGKGALLELLKGLHSIEGLRRIRIGSLEPRIITEDFAQALGELPKICPHFHLSLQSGCQETLNRMNRRYTTVEYLEKTEILRGYFEHPAITTDIIVGFPGETEEEFLTTENFLDKVKFYEMHVFKYSSRKGTVAAGMPNQVEESVKTKRSTILMILGKEQSAQFREYYRSSSVEVLFEEEKTIEGKVYWIGYTREYIKAAVQSEESLANKIIKCQYKGLLTEDIIETEIL